MSQPAGCSCYRQRLQLRRKRTAVRDASLRASEDHKLLKKMWIQASRRVVQTTRDIQEHLELERGYWVTGALATKQKCFFSHFADNYSVTNCCT